MGRYVCRQICIDLLMRKQEVLKKGQETKKAEPMRKMEPVKPKFVAEQYARAGVPAHEVEEIKEAFDLFDTDQSGSVDIKELKAAMTSLGFQKKNALVFQMICDLDEDGTGAIEFDEWFSLMTSKVHHTNSRDSYRKIFNLFDDQRTGFITLNNLRRVCEEIGENIPQEQMQQMIRRAGLESPDAVTQEEFYIIMTRKIKTI